MFSIKFKSLVLLFVIFFISANLAWLNPTDNNPERPSLYKTHNTIPLFWQYNLDSGIEILTAAYFPNIYEKNNTRIDRPTYPAIANIFGKAIGLMAKPLVKLSNLEKAGMGYLSLKILVYLSSILLLQRILLMYFDERSVFLSIFFTYSTTFSIFFFTAFHTSELQFITPIFIIYFFLSLIKNYTLKKNIIFSFIVGLLMLAKPNYAIYASLILFLTYKRQWAVTLISIISHLVPIVSYIFLINYLGYNFTIKGATDYNQGVWIFEEVKNFEFVKIFYLMTLAFGKFIVKMWSIYKLLLIFSIIGIYIKFYKNKINLDYLVFIIIFVFFTFFQIFVSNRYVGYMTYDLAIIIYAFASYAIYKIVDQLKNNYLKKYSIPIIMCLYLTYNVSLFIHLPWVHPYDQVSKSADVLNNKLSELDDNIKIEN